MKLIFLGTRGGIKARSRKHYRHTSLLIYHGATTIVIDWGSDWATKASLLTLVQGLFITHAHPDHIGGLQQGIPCPMYTTKDVEDTMPHYPLSQHTLTPSLVYQIGSLTITAIPVEHSLRAPAVGYRISSTAHTIFYVPDIALLPAPVQTLANVDLYIGDGALISRHMLLRTKDHTLTGHAPITDQLSWCQEAGVQHCIITHCGTEIVRGKHSIIDKRINELSTLYGVTTRIAYDGMTIDLGTYLRRS
jgi:ribonuclease BN (tRNA processing enzyme)